LNKLTDAELQSAGYCYCYMY